MGTDARFPPDAEGETSPLYGESGGGLVELNEADCRRLLRSGDVGRVVYTDGALPAVTPVNYVFDDDGVVLRTASGSRLAVKLPGSIVAFEVDELDRGARSGWSVVVTGPCHVVTDPERIVQISLLTLVPWVSSARSELLEITAGLLTGRRIVP